MVKVPVRPAGYAIYNPKTDKWSRGGSRPTKWGKTPKIWSHIGHLKNHIRLYLGWQYAYRWNEGKPDNFEAYIIHRDYDGCMIIDVATGEELKDFTIHDYLLDAAKREIAESKYRAHWQIIDEWENK